MNSCPGFDIGEINVRFGFADPQNPCRKKIKILFFEKGGIVGTITQKLMLFRLKYLYRTRITYGSASKTIPSEFAGFIAGNIGTHCSKEGFL